MSSWTIVTLRGRPASDYDFTRSDSADRWDATADIVATMDGDGRIRRWTTWSGHVYAYLDRSFEPEWAEEVLGDYAPMADAAVVLDANDTSDTGRARYYPNPGGAATDRYQETQAEDGYFVGQLALAAINARHGILARDPFHNTGGMLDDRYLEDGQPHGEREVADA